MMGEALLQVIVAGRSPRPLQLMTHDPVVALYSDTVLRIWHRQVVVLESLILARAGNRPVGIEALSCQGKRATVGILAAKVRLITDEVRLVAGHEVAQENRCISAVALMREA